jgi:DNA polymerase
MQSVRIRPDFESWRKAARRLLLAGVAPDAVLWSDSVDEGSLFAEQPTAPESSGVLKVSAAFLDLARSASVHGDPRRWGVFYRMLWRIARGGERHLLQVPSDPDTRLARNWSHAVGRDIHRMHAFVRFRLVDAGEPGGREQFIAWFEPEFRIVRLAAPFFAKRFAGMDWSILTPSECAHWDGCALQFSPGVPRDGVPDADAQDDLWRAYYRGTFNPARLRVRAMQSEMPKKYWKNLPEARLIGSLIAGSRERVQSMLDAPELAAKPAPRNSRLPDPPATGDGTACGGHKNDGDE